MVRKVCSPQGAPGTIYKSKCDVHYQSRRGARHATHVPGILHLGAPPYSGSRHPHLNAMHTPPLNPVSHLSISTAPPVMACTTDPIAALGEDVFLLVLEHLQPADVIALGSVSRSWRAFVDEHEVWRGVCRRAGIDVREHRHAEGERQAIALGEPYRGDLAGEASPAECQRACEWARRRRSYQIWTTCVSPKHGPGDSRTRTSSRRPHSSCAACTWTTGRTTSTR